MAPGREVRAGDSVCENKRVSCCQSRGVSPCVGASVLDWLITIGVFAVLSGVALRIITMMRARDASGVGSDTLFGRDLVRAHNRAFPRSWLPMLSRLLLLVGLAFLLVGGWMELRG